ncbi:uncharacterized protein LOC124134974 [Haliotis rufescens]|uniref:uncharacterized protein LOC124134974 n=1 Tax=Haliotis rufescens TaxID=6454 RepID=UPI00201EE581|nr:uncharacterized protein LOC124134974 [Haliotis rufescens]
MKIVVLWAVFCVFCIPTINGGRRFKHQSRGNDVDDDAEWELNSRGLLSHIVNLDVLPDVSVAENSKGEIIVNLQDTSVASAWKPGWYLMSTNVRQRYGLEVKHVAIVKKIQHVDIVSPTKVKVYGIDVSALDLLQEAQVFLRYPHLTNKHGHRQKRYVSNLLSKVLDKINFHATDGDESINFNFDPKTNHSSKTYSVYKEQGDKEVKVEKINKGQTSAIPGDADFRLTCKNCYEQRHLGHTMDLQIERRNKTATVKKFLMQSDVSTDLNVEFEVKFKKALGLTERIVMERTPSTILRTIPVAIVDEKLPAIQLVISYDKTVYLEINATSDGPINYSGKFHVQGNYTMTSTEASENVPKTDLTTTAWSSSEHSFSGHSSKPYNISMALYQEVTLQASVQWSQHDVSLVFTPPEVASFRPVLYARTTEDEYSRCETATLTVDGIFTFDKSDFVAKAFHKTIWDLDLIDTSLFHKYLITEPLSNVCSANCGPPVADVHGKAMEDICGASGDKIVRGDSNFNKLTLIGGDFILFRSEESESSTWCGKSGRACHTCVWSDNGDNRIDACADRLMSSVAASTLTTLGQLAAKEWPNRKLVVLEAWDEPTSADPHGSHGITSLHYTGRALQVALTTENTSNSTSLQIEKSTSVLKRLAELGACAGFPFFDVSSGHVQFCVHDDYLSQRRSRRSAMGPSANNLEKDYFMRTMNKTGIVPIKCIVDNIKQWINNHHGPIFNEVINPLLQERNIQYRLIQYPFDDLTFDPEGSLSAMCYQSTRRCKSTCEWSDSTEPWDWCQTRVMTPRMAIRLRRLAAIASQHNSGTKLRVTKPSQEVHNGAAKDKSFESNGRKLQISLPSVTTISISKLRSMANCAGFDFVDTSKSSSIDVYVKLQDGYQATIVPFQDTTLLAVGVEDEDYAYPEELKNEFRTSLLFDGFNPHEQISEHFKVSDFKHSEKRFFRLDQYMADCLELVVHDLGEAIKIIPDSAYRSHSINMRDIAHRHPQEKVRFETGQAVYVTAMADLPNDFLVNLGYSFLRSCPPILRLQSRGLGIGCHSNKIYIDIRPMAIDDDIADVWDADNKPVFDIIQRAMDDLKRGGPVIYPLNLKRTCQNPRCGEQFAYYSFNKHSFGFCFHDRESTFCRDTREHRQQQANTLRDDLMKVAGTTMTRSSIEKDLQECVLDNCGGCPGKGPTWDKKVLGCVGMVHTYLTLANNQFSNVVNKAAFFNTDNAESSVHSLACHDDAVCVENTQIYSLIMPLLNSKYQPDPKQSREEMLYSGDNNPSPLITLIEQEFARQISGVVKVYIESETDMAAMRDVIKILMIYNRDVTEVEFHLTDTVDQDNVVSALQRKLEYWSGTACPKWSRFAVAGFSIHDIPHHRRKRSLERSRSRNKVKKAMKEWELDWIKKM